MPSLDSFPKEGVYLLGTYYLSWFYAQVVFPAQPHTTTSKKRTVGGYYRLLNLRAIYTTLSDIAMSRGAIHPTLKRVGFLAFATPYRLS